MESLGGQTQSWASGYGSEFKDYIRKGGRKRKDYSWLALNCFKSSMAGKVPVTYNFVSIQAG